MYYFASDIHLGGGDPARMQEIERRFAAWLDRAGRDADAICLLGDIFDFWFEYRQVVPKGFVRVLGKMAELTDRGVRILLITGNHDMWMYDYLTKECGVEVSTRPVLLEAAGKRIFLAHGDNMNIGRQPLLKLMNTLFRSRTLRFLFSWLVHPDWAMRFGRWWSGRSYRSHHRTPPQIGQTEPLIEYARSRHDELQADCYLFGHMHVARDYREEGLHVVLLGSWEEEQPAVAVLDGNGEVKLTRIAL